MRYSSYAEIPRPDISYEQTLLKVHEPETIPVCVYPGASQSDHPSMIMRACTQKLSDERRCSSTNGGRASRERTQVISPRAPMLLGALEAGRHSSIDYNVSPTDGSACGVLAEPSLPAACEVDMPIAVVRIHSRLPEIHGALQER